ncbi:hypothetical protein CTP45_07780 [Salmonella enterica]|uniref:Uncharacterized protein n=1 Tax=Salmonella enterica subsp. enterica serovar Saintpaul TaxID=90105 RepID=A0A5U9I8C5_SALET|nr:hypothetical protein [Salmonella enterica]EBS2301358.1 hypothetical protein [Salmonella enterica subsp. enterica serovar Saintpaul]EDW0017492.1 hypothetical protein [Salmonella enterica subsp. enterica serovar Aba]HCZ4727716.1 hypothetical protein [Salmonella enterica subsp. enterica serovar Saintpaul str. CFSAN004137]EAW8023114.1 hypothetical protein [Salmonella enterica]
MLLDNEKISSEAEFNAVCSMIGKPFERVSEYIQRNYYMSDALNLSLTSGKRDQALHKINNIKEVTTIINNAVKSTVPEINI